MKKQEGITLVALVVTIVVLLILAGVTITYVLNDTGVIGKAREAATKNEGAVVAENIQDAIVAVQIEMLAGKITLTEGKADVTTQVQTALGTTGITIEPAGSAIEMEGNSTVTFATTGVTAKYANKTYTIEYDSGKVTATEAATTTTPS